MSNKIQNLAEFILPDATTKVEVNLGYHVQSHSKKLMGQERFMNLF